MTKTLALLLFYLLVFPAGLISRSMTKDPLKRKIDPGSTTYWEKW